MEFINSNLPPMKVPKRLEFRLNTTMAQLVV